MDQLSVLAGSISTTIFAVSHLPMLLRAFRTKDLHSYSLVNLVLANIGNIFHWIYIVSLPVGPIWVLHTFYSVTSALMLLWYWMYRRSAPPARRSGARGDMLMKELDHA